MYKSLSAASKLLKRASSSSSSSTCRWSHGGDWSSPATFTSQIRASSSQISSPASQHAFRGILTSLPKPGGGEFGKLYSSPALSDPRIDKLPYSVRTFHESAVRHDQVKKEDAEKIFKGTAVERQRGKGWIINGLIELNPFWHIEEGIKEILMDYVHHEITLNVVLVFLRLFTIIATVDVFLAVFFP